MLDWFYCAKTSIISVRVKMTLKSQFGKKQKFAVCDVTRLAISLCIVLS